MERLVYDAYRVDFQRQHLGHILFLIWLRNFNQLDATSKVMYRHFVQETRSSLIKHVLFVDNDVTMQWLPHSGKFVNKANTTW